MPPKKQSAPKKEKKAADAKDKEDKKADKNANKKNDDKEECKKAKPAKPSNGQKDKAGKKIPCEYDSPKFAVKGSHHCKAHGPAFQEGNEVRCSSTRTALKVLEDGAPDQTCTLEGDSDCSIHKEGLVFTETDSYTEVSCHATGYPIETRYNDACVDCDDDENIHDYGDDDGRDDDDESRDDDGRDEDDDDDY